MTMAVDWQVAVTALLVAGCAVYALRNLWPRGWWPRKLSAATPTSAGGACGGCDGCSSTAKPASGASPLLAPGESVIRIVRRQPQPGASR